MALPICIEIPEIPDPFDITLPGGITIQHINLMEIIQPALTPRARRQPTVLPYRSRSRSRVAWSRSVMTAAKVRMRW